MKKEIADKILLETSVGYDLISRKFSQTRKHFWRGLEFLADYANDGEKILDYGCGNGRLLEIFDGKNIEYYGVDVSEKLLEYAREKFGNEKKFLKLDPSQSSLALESEFFNTVYSIAVFHHLPSVYHRKNIAKEIFRVTNSGGHMVVTVWHLWPAFSAIWRIWRGKQKSYFKYIFKNWVNKLKGESSLDWNDCMIPFTDNSGVRIERFHHAFTKRELQKLFESAGFETEKCEIVDGKNILYIGKKG